MKKYFVTFICLCAAANGFAQFSIGAKAGLAVSDFHNGYETKANAGFKAGLSLQYMFSEWGLQSGVYFKKVGVADSKGFLPSNSSALPLALSMERRLEYVEIPLTVVYKYPVDRHVKVEIHAGPYLGIGCGGTGVLDVDGLYTSVGIDAFEDTRPNDGQYLKDVTFKGANKIDMGLTGGLGVDIYNVNISANYDWGLSNVYKEYPINADVKNVKNRAFWVAVAYHFQL
ncbi:MAG: PorT family protein [Tannerellaceae bacterium]|jgi:hypothetical protein|nr:PorT family protein [Tannerellaceae bacterium]